MRFSKKKNNQLVSIIMNCQNGEQYLQKAINSIISQSYKNWELIFWDNRSTDNSKKILDSFLDKRIRYFKAKKNTKLYEARNLAIKKARGKFVSFLDVDDWWLPQKLEKQMEVFNKDRSLEIVYSKCYWYYQKLKIKKINSILDLPSGLITQKLLNKYVMSILTVLIKKQLFKYYRFNKNFDIIGDYDFFLRISTNKKIECVQEPLAFYRSHGSNLSKLKMGRFISELTHWINKNRKMKMFKNFSFRGIIITLQCLKIQKLLASSKRLYALKEIFINPFSLKKIKFLIFVFLSKSIFFKFKS